jgi:hypothetical protein
MYLSQLKLHLPNQGMFHLKKFRRTPGMLIRVLRYSVVNPGLTLLFLSWRKRNRSSRLLKTD